MNLNLLSPNILRPPSTSPRVVRRSAQSRALGTRGRVAMVEKVIKLTKATKMPRVETTGTHTPVDKPTVFSDRPRRQKTNGMAAMPKKGQGWSSPERSHGAAVRPGSPRRVVSGPRCLRPPPLQVLRKPSPQKGWAVETTDCGENQKSDGNMVLWVLPHHSNMVLVYMTSLACS